MSSRDLCITGGVGGREESEEILICFFSRRGLPKGLRLKSQLKVELDDECGDISYPMNWMKFRTIPTSKLIMHLFTNFYAF